MSIPCTGKRCHPFEHDYPCGNIPAHAGKTPVHGGPASFLPEHPRARGENFLALGTPWPRGGTSPRTRGKQGVGENPGLGGRNIPAHAGKTDCRYLSAGVATEHPRARGENSTTQSSPATLRGTSPRTRGKPVGETVELRQGGNIPAHAGKTTAHPEQTAGPGEHPRARGENSVDLGAALGKSGTSPRTRGKPEVQAVPWSRSRNIPAHAGKTWWWMP